jgi:NAD(P)-dependent dehydrogenase (short-subunit alcohol dehydrogenase family)
MRVVISGASRGIGRAIALAIAPECESMVLVARRRNLLDDAKAAVENVNPACRAMACAYDISRPDPVDACFKEIANQLGHFDALINCAGKAMPKTALQEITYDAWTEVFAVNVSGMFLMTKCAIPFLRQSNRPTIINIASTAGITPRPGWSAYAASKAAVVSFSMTMAEELQPYGIRVFCLAPGRTATDLRKTLAPDEDPRTIMQPDELARIVRILLSEAGDILDGQTIVCKKTHATHTS